MFIAKCLKCGEVMGAILNPGSITYIQCMNCEMINHSSACIDPKSYYEDVREVAIRERNDSREAELRAVLLEQSVLV